MSVSFGTPSTHTASGAGPMTRAHEVENVGGDRMLIVLVAGDGFVGGAWTVTYAGLAMTLLAARVTRGNDEIEVWYLLDPPVGTANVVFTYPGAPTAIVMIPVVAMGVDLSDPWGNTASTSSGASPVSTSVASDVSQTVIAAVAADNTGGTGDLSPQAGQTQIAEVFHAGGGVPANSKVAGLSYEQGAPTVTSGYNVAGGGNNELIVAAIKAASAPRGRLSDYYVGFWDPELVLTNNEGAIVPANEVNADTWLYTRGLDMGHPVIYDSFVQDPSKSRIVEAIDVGGRLDLKANKSQFARIIIERAREGV